MEQERNNNDINQTQQQPHEQRTNSTRSPPVTRASPVAQQQRTANTGLPRRRIKWTPEMNVSVLRAYFRATRDESIISYRQQMYNFFLNDYPELSHISLQNLADRRAAIVRNNLVPPALQEEIRQSVRNENSPNNNGQHQTLSTTTQLEITPETAVNQNNNQVQQESILNTHSDSHTDVPQSQPDDISSIIKNIFNEAKTKFIDLGQQYRPFLPKQKPNKKMQQITEIINTKILPSEIPLNVDYNLLIGFIYCSAYTTWKTMKILRGENNRNNNNQILDTEELNNTNSHRSRRTTTNSPETKPSWQIRLQKKIDEIRKDLGYITSYMNNRTGKRSKHKLKRIERKYYIHTQFDPPNRTMEQIRDTIRQKLAKYATRLRNYTRSHNRSKHNRLFLTNEKLFYTTIAKPIVSNIETNNNTNMQEIENYWRTIWNEQLTHDSNATWIPTAHRSTSVPTMSNSTITVDILKKAIVKLHNWKQPGCDKIHNFFYKYLTATHPHIIRIFNDVIMNPSTIQPEMCAGVTYLKPKCLNPTASQYRPITCLNTGYKLLTSCLTIMISEFCESNNILAEEQKGCRQGTRGCKDQLIIDSVVTTQAIRNKKNLYTAFIDYQKAFDSVPHSWLLETLWIYGINPIIINFIRGLMNYWETTLHLREGNNGFVSNPIRIKRGIYQGDSLSPLLFCLALNPLSSLLRQSQYGYKLKNTDQYKICHCFYMDDLKLYASSKQNLRSLIQIVETFTKDIKMKFGIDKCKTQSITKGKYSSSEDFVTTKGEHITPLQRDECYKYLGIRQHIAIAHSAQKKEIETQFTNRIYRISKSSLNGRNLIKAVNTYAVPLLTYTFGILHWSSTDLNNMDRQIRTILTKTKHHHPKSSIERMNIPRKQGGRGLLNIQILHDRQIQNLRKYFVRAADTSILYRSIVNADDRLTPLNLKNDDNINPDTIQNLIQKWKSKPLHGKYPNYIYQQHVDLETTNKWLLFSNLFSETEGYIIAMQDGVLKTKNYRKYILKDNTITDDKCRRCGVSSETIPHILNSCTALTANHYRQRHDNVGKIVHIEILKSLKIDMTTTFYYKYNPEPIIENQKYTIYWDRSILVNNPPETTIANRPDMVIIDKEERTAKIIDFAVPFDNNIQDTITTKKTKYRQLSEYLRNTQNIQSIDIIPIVISSLGTIPKETTESIGKLNLRNSVLTEIQKSVLIRAATIMRETLS